MVELTYSTRSRDAVAVYFRKRRYAACAYQTIVRGSLVRTSVFGWRTSLILVINAWSMV